MLQAVMKGPNQKQSTHGKNVKGDELRVCSSGTGWERDGFCRYRKEDGGKHLVCATMTSSFLDFTKKKGNDLTSSSSNGFKGLKEGDRWCICAGRYSEAERGGVAPPVDLDATDEHALHWGPVSALVGRDGLRAGSRRS